jgi:uncharacterized membrane protein YjjB (DUF3815 family)
MQLVLLALGITGAAALAGVPAIDLDTAALPLGPVAPWIAVAVFGVGILVNRCARPRSAGWVLLVLYIAYGAQVLGDALLGRVLSAFVGAVVMTPVAVLISRAPGGPPPMVSFLPAYWLLVPGALGLEGVTSLLHGDVTGFATLTTTLTTMVAVSLGGACRVRNRLDQSCCDGAPARRSCHRAARTWRRHSSATTASLSRKPGTRPRTRQRHQQLSP